MLAEEGYCWEHLMKFNLANNYLKESNCALLWTIFAATR